MSDTKTRDDLAAEIEVLRGKPAETLGRWLFANRDALLAALRPAEPAQARAEVLEEAAKVAEAEAEANTDRMSCWRVADKIARVLRALALQQKDAAS